MVTRRRTDLETRNAEPAIASSPAEVASPLCQDRGANLNYRQTGGELGEGKAGPATPGRAGTIATLR